MPHNYYIIQLLFKFLDILNPYFLYIKYFQMTLLGQAKSLVYLGFNVSMPNSKYAHFEKLSIPKNKI